MNRLDIQNKVRDILQNMLNLEKPIIESLTSTTNLITALNLTSIDAMQLLVLIERDFEILIDDEDIGKELIQSLDSITNKIIEIKYQKDEVLK